MILFNNAKDNQFVKSITNGLNFSTEFAYAPITNTGIYTKGVGATFPVVDYQGPIYVVSSVKSDNGIGGLAETDYSYSGLKIHLQGKGLLGFAKTTKFDITSGIQVENTLDYNHQFYYSYPLRSETKITGGSQASVTDYTYDVKDFTNKRIWPFVSMLVSNDILHNINQTSHFTYDDYGNQTSATIIHNNEGSTWTNDTYVNAGAWCPSKPETSSTTRVFGDAPYTRTKSYTYNNNGQVLTETSDPATAKWITTTYEYNNQFGLPTKTTINGADINGSRITSYEYDSKARFLVKGTNSLGQYTLSTYNSENGNIMTSTDINGLQTTYNYDALGRLNLTTLPDGNTVSSSLFWNDNYAPANSVYYDLTQASGSVPVRTYYDLFGRVLRQVNKGFDGTDIYTDKTYNTLGQVYQSSDPYFSTAQPEWTTYSYDVYGRSTGVSSPLSNVTMAYSARSVTTTNISTSPYKVFTKTFDALGQTVTATDAGGTLSYAYYSSGKPKTIISPGNVITSMQYDNWGNQTQLIEPNAGTIAYTYDAFHQLLTQTKNGIASSLTYDGLGRLNTLTETEGTTTYTYDTKTYGKGLLAGISAPGGVSGDYNYDSYGRLLSKTETIDGNNFTESLQYDNFGRLLTLTYPSNFGISYNYNNNNYLSEIKRADNSTSIWKAQVMNARGQIEQFELGNGLSTSQTFDHGFMTGIQTGSLQNLQYNWDMATGNLNWRKDANRNLTENFSYDNLNRLTGITGSTTSSYTFADNGNIASSSAAGAYTYNAAKPHAVESVTNPQGLIPSTDQTLQYTSFDKVKLITEGAKTLNLYYGADKERRKMVYNDGNNILTRYYAHGNYEKETGAINRELFYISTGTGVAAIYEKKAEGNQMYYISKDHLGSVNVITNESAAVVEEMSFDTWGRRRNPTNWSYAGVPTTHIFDRGFTGHEHLDQFGLINMNGRVYDQMNSRFLSPDKILQDPENTQSYNRYSYCFNNPLKYTDPTGWEGEPHDLPPWVTNSNWRPPQPSWTGIPYEYGPPPDPFKMSNLEWMYATSPARYMPEYQQAMVDNINSSIFALSVVNYKTGGRGSWVRTDNDRDEQGTFMIKLQWVPIRYKDDITISEKENSNTNAATIQKVNTISGWLGLAFDGSRQFLNYTKAGSNLGYKIAYNSILANGVNYLKPLSKGANAFTTGIAYYQIANGTSQPITYVDAGVGTMGIIASGASYFYGVQIPVVGEFVAVYGVTRITWDVFYDLGAKYGPNW